jgi:hypothetical protein
VGGSGGAQYAAKDPEFGSDNAQWKKKLILHDDDQADPDANAGRSSGKPWTPPPPAQETFAAAAPSKGGGGWDTPAPASEKSSSGGGGGDPWANQGQAAPKTNFGGGGGGGGGSSGAQAKRQSGITYDPDQYDPNP